MLFRWQGGVLKNSAYCRVSSVPYEMVLLTLPSVQSTFGSPRVRLKKKERKEKAGHVSSPLFKPSCTARSLRKKKRPQLILDGPCEWNPISKIISHSFTIAPGRICHKSNVFFSSKTNASPSDPWQIRFFVNKVIKRCARFYKREKSGGSTFPQPMVIFFSEFPPPQNGVGSQA